MKKIFTLLACGVLVSLHAQTTTNLFTENFNSGGGSFTLNTTDMSSVTSGTNSWVVNSTYPGGVINTECPAAGFTFPISIAATPNQPAGIVSSPTSGYLHIVSTEGLMQGVTNCHFKATLNACGYSNENYFTKMSSDVNTVGGYDTVKISFWWLCAGSPTNFGEVYYSTDAGASWTLIGTPISSYQAQSTWVKQTITMAGFNNEATLRFGFRFVNNNASSASDPAFAIDDIQIDAVTNAAGGPTVTPQPINGSPFCAGQGFNLAYTVSGTYTAGNTFTAQLSDASGSFASPVTLGSVTSTTSGNISCTTPAGTPTGTGYMVRIVSYSPVTTSTMVGPITINALPVATASNTGPYCAGNTIQLNASGGGGYGWTGPASYSNGTQNPSITSSTVAMGGVYTVTVTSTAGCSTTATTTVVVNSCAGIEDENLMEVNIYPNPATDGFNLQLNEAMINDAQVSIINMVGEVLYTLTPSQVKTNISTTGFRAGIYLVQVKYKGQHKTTRLVIR